ncbi:hypothetical protein [Methanosarcina mazei]|uniref:hypothetical protein n=1 Tax=Methanosarcina mazei TaxID=2209 RepID=UPI000AF15ABD|nr:hypothetical protein [Methanosarcina mazei]
MRDTTPEDLLFSSWAAQTYEQKKDAVNFLENSFDPYERAIGTLIKKYAGCEQNA